MSTECFYRKCVVLKGERTTNPIAGGISPLRLNGVLRLELFLEVWEVKVLTRYFSCFVHPAIAFR